MPASAYPVYFQYTSNAITTGTFDLLFVVYGGTNIAIVDTATNTVTGTINTGGGNGITAMTTSRDGKILYVAQATPNRVKAFSVATKLQIGASLVVGNQAFPSSMALSVDSTKLYVCNLTDNTVTEINAVTWVVTATRSTAPNGPRSIVCNAGSPAVIAVGTGVGITFYDVTWAVLGNIAVLAVYDIKLMPDGINGYYISFSGNTVTPVNTATFVAGADIPVGAGPTGINVSPSGTRVYVVNQTGKSISVVDTTTNTVVQTVLTASNIPDVAATNFDGTKLYLGHLGGGDNNLATYTTSGGVVLAPPINVGSQPSLLARAMVTVDVMPPAPLAQVPSDDQWNVTVAVTAATAGIGLFTVYSGQRVIGTANVGASVGPFTAYFGEQIAVTVTQAVSGYIATVSGNGYNKHGSPAEYPGTPSITR
jgi:YVTN family beta-propeller protein